MAMVLRRVANRAVLCRYTPVEQRSFAGSVADFDRMVAARAAALPDRSTLGAVAAKIKPVGAVLDAARRSGAALRGSMVGEAAGRSAPGPPPVAAPETQPPDPLGDPGQSGCVEERGRATLLSALDTCHSRPSPRSFQRAAGSRVGGGLAKMVEVLSRYSFDRSQYGSRQRVTLVDKDRVYAVTPHGLYMYGH